MKTALYRFFSVLSICAGIAFMLFGLYQFSVDKMFDMNLVGLGIFGCVFPFALRWFLLETD